MKRSDINRVFQQAKMFFEENGWYLPPNPRWDISDIGRFSGIEEDEPAEVQLLNE